VKPLLWAARTDPRGRTPYEKLCMGCHSAEGGAVVPTVVRHPETALQKLVSSTTQPTELDNKLKLIGEISCSTCHVPHGREIDVRGLSPAVARAMLSSKKPMLRPDVDREICSICHGIDSTRVYLYFHNPKKRAEVKRFILQP
jgi:cytochrome c